MTNDKRQKHDREEKKTIFFSFFFFDFYTLVTGTKSIYLAIVSLFFFTILILILYILYNEIHELLKTQKKKNLPK